MNAAQRTEFSEFIKEMNDSINELCIDCHEYYEDDAISSYDSDEIDEPDTDELGEDEYKYLTKIGAMSACKRALKKMLRLSKKSFKDTMRAAVSEMKEYFDEEMDDYLENVEDFIEDFSEDYDDYEFEDSYISDITASQKSRYFGNLLSPAVIDELKFKLNTCVTEILNSYKPSLPEDMFSLDSLMEQCEFDYDDDDRRYDFELSDACDTVTDALNNRIETTAEELFNEVDKACFNIISAYADKLKNALSNIYFNNYGEDAPSSALIEQFAVECLTPPEFDDDFDNFIDAFSDQPNSWIVYPWN